MKRLSIPRRVLLCLLGVLLLISLWAVFQRMLYEFQGPLTWDTPLYWAVGRCIVNGLIPYRDLFETKPPGIFLLSALSFWLFDAPILGHVIEGLSVLAYPAVIGWHAWKETKRTGYMVINRWIVVCIALIAGSILGLYTFERSGEFQVESFGALCAMFYLATIADHTRMPVWKMSLASVWIALAALMKEPFVLTVSAAALILCMERPLMLLRTLIIPMIGAGILFILVLAATQTLLPYLTIYLPETLLQEVDGAGPIWSHLGAWHILLSDTDGYLWSLGILLVSCIVVLWFHPPLGKKKHLHVLPQRIILSAVALSLAITAVAMKGNFYNHQFVFAVPVYGAILMAFMTSLAHLRGGNKVFQTSAVLCTILLLLSVMFLPHPNYHDRLQNIQHDSQAAAAAAHTVDAILDACHINQYLYLGTNGIRVYGYTHHSPLGPAFVQFPHYLDPTRTYFRQTYLSNLQKTQLIVRDTEQPNALTAITHDIVSRSFTTVPWSCASGIPGVQSTGYTLLYRQN